MTLTERATLIPPAAGVCGADPARTIRPIDGNGHVPDNPGPLTVTVTLRPRVHDWVRVLAGDSGLTLEQVIAGIVEDTARRLTTVDYGHIPPEPVGSCRGSRVDNLGRECAACYRYLPWSAFTRRPEGYHGYSSHCGACQSRRRLLARQRAAAEMA